MQEGNAGEARGGREKQGRTGGDETAGEGPGASARHFGIVGRLQEHV